MKKTAYLLFVLIFASAFGKLDAQTLGENPVTGTNVFDNGLENSGYSSSNSLSDYLSLDISPTSPGPNDDVTVKITSNSTDLNKAQITWRINNKIVLDQVGAKQLIFTLGQLNESQSLTVTVTKYEGGEITATHFFTPTEVDLIYEPLTYTPPFYRGRAWPTHQSSVRVVAFPRILDDYNRLIPAEEYSYTWRENGRVVQDQSGYGKNVFTYTNGLLEEVVDVSVEVVPRNYNAYARGSVVIEPRDPVIAVYEKNPVYGTVFEQAISGIFSLDREEITLKMIPYFFSSNALNSTWGMNGKVISDLQRPDEVVFRVEGEAEGVSNISVNVSNEERVLQSAGTGFQLLFKK